jgi:hypothetical protein
MILVESTLLIVAVDLLIYTIPPDYTFMNKFTVESVNVRSALTKHTTPPFRMLLNSLKIQPVIITSDEFNANITPPLSVIEDESLDYMVLNVHDDIKALPPF